MKDKQVMIPDSMEVQETDLIQSFEKPLLAFDALSKLTKQFACDPDFERLIQLVLLTLSGQFSAPNAFASIWPQNSEDSPASYYAAGPIKRNASLEDLLKSNHSRKLLDDLKEALIIEESVKNSISGNILQTMKDAGVAVIAPLWHNNKLIGVLGLGDKVNRKPYDNDEFTLFIALVHSIVPLVANSLLFTEITGLNSWYLAILDNIQQGIFVFDSENKLIKINKTALEIITTFQYNLGSRSILGQSLTEIFPENIFRGWARQLSDSKNKKGRAVVENLLASNSKTQRLYNARISMTHDRANIGENLIIAVEDITSQRDNEIRFFELEKLAEKGLMASSISHELNNYLGLMVGGVELAKISLDNGNMPKTITNLDRLKTNLDQMQRFVKGLLNLGVMSPRKIQANLNSIIYDILPFVTIQKKFKNIEIEVECLPDLPNLHLDTDQISQLVINFLNNSADAIIEAGKSTGQILVKTRLDRDEITFLIRDNGIGIKPGIKDKLFKSRLTTKKDGHGFGLATCAKIVENHAGTINIESEFGIGTTFTICFPLDKAL